MPEGLCSVTASCKTQCSKTSTYGSEIRNKFRTVWRNWMTVLVGKFRFAMMLVVRPGFFETQDRHQFVRALVEQGSQRQRSSTACWRDQ